MMHCLCDGDVLSQNTDASVCGPHVGYWSSFTLTDAALQHEVE